MYKFRVFLALMVLVLSACAAAPAVPAVAAAPVVQPVEAGALVAQPLMANTPIPTPTQRVPGIKLEGMISQAQGKTWLNLIVTDTATGSAPIQGIEMIVSVDGSTVCNQTVHAQLQCEFAVVKFTSLSVKATNTLIGKNCPMQLPVNIGPNGTKASASCAY